ncbi:MAG TPA: DUF488 domain-containing protein [Geminicoccus sp.]|jgi:uncharacterized protein (DUF488 family)|uniref:DUF488 domain-containing protein n=1 Tax=Geminicoccus sp. TaxID=2024832 RepID=UPI002E35C906|nr:DUF488 domain-containing protein [Geminicoccus sp.]HEX2528132.1 DUF488 domain-containing protein [Geminicoccus sp.]
MTRPLFTVGYEGLAQQDVLDVLKATGIELLVDVRAVSASRRAGFSKNALRSGVAAVGVDYLHLRELGTPADGRLAARTGRYDELRRIFDAHMESPEAIHALETLRTLARQKRCCLLCYERQPHQCHRVIIAERLGMPTQHLLA